ncbi:hypothetical protein LWI28_017975 [Acer negundo]|uniref:Uncharacterized protein n=1 Tax=Acer negundo TaxID=4023 RepID=A0AAD5IZY6_ACENE|nr:hypothetical protein LWI28_017975 [Acer negundo]KAK4849654.1 hypothetical protein QYF36_027022 [Acer negundo]
MARSISNAKLFSTFVVDGISNAINRRGYAAAAAASQGVLSRGSGMVKKTVEEIAGSTEKVAWVPDPVTGYYRPENLANEIDVADLRATLLKNNN